MLMMFREVIAVFCESTSKHLNTLFGQNAEFFSVKAGATLMSIVL